MASLKLGPARIFTPATQVVQAALATAVLSLRLRLEICEAKASPRCAQGVRKEIGKLSIFCVSVCIKLLSDLFLLLLLLRLRLRFACEHAFRYEGFGVSTPLGMRSLGWTRL